MIIRRSKAISTVLTTMIILVAAIVLATGVVIYGTSLFQTGAQQEAITIQGVSMWVNATNSSGVAWGAVGVRNSGDKLVSVDTIQIRGVSIPFSNWYVDKSQTRVTTENFQSQFKHNGTDLTNLHELRDSVDASSTVTTSCPTSVTLTDDNTIETDFDGAGSKPTICLLQASGPTSLNPGEKLIVYFKVPHGVIGPVDSGSATSVSLFAGKTGAPTSVTIGNP